ncbi:MAG: chemotaxis protein CheW [Polyangiaceae bacterium]
MDPDDEWLQGLQRPTAPHEHGRALAMDEEVAVERRQGSLELLREPICVVWLDGACYGLPLAVVGELAPLGFVVQVPLCPAPILGVFSLRGAPLPVIDLAAALGLGSARGGQNGLVLRDGDRQFAIPVERVEVLGGSRRGARRPRLETDHPSIAGFIELDDAQVVTLLSAGSIRSAFDELRDGYRS